jgi:hypothetical protein
MLLEEKVATFSRLRKVAEEEDGAGKWSYEN